MKFYELLTFNHLLLIFDNTLIALNVKVIHLSKEVTKLYIIGFTVSTVLNELCRGIETYFRC